MPNDDIQATWHYHEATAHSAQSVRADRHYLDWANRPLLFKIYSELDPISLPRDWPASNVAAFSAICPAAQPVTETGALNLRTLASILFHAAGVTRRRSYPGGEIYFRAAACTGALYEIELYIVCGQLPDLGAGVYHFDPADFALRKLRDGDLRYVVAHSTANHPAVSHAPMTIVCTGTYWRNAWKYQARTYRHFFWDNGTLLANLLATAAALRLPSRLVMGFVDESVNQLLGLEALREVAISLVTLGQGNEMFPAPSIQLPALEYRIAPYSKTEVDYPLMRETHEASCLLSSPEVEEWRGRPPSILEQAPSGRPVDLKVVPEPDLPQDPIEKVILRRGSTRQFAQVPIRFEQLSMILVHATRGIPADFLEPFGTRLNELYLIVNAVEGLPAGAYYLRRDRPCLELLKEGRFREQAGHLGLDQSLPADASVAIFFLADLKPILERFGNRGYRAAQIEAGMIVGKIYLGAYALRLGATGLTFYDNEVTDFFSPHAAGKSAIFLTAVGVPNKRAFQVV
ncbi:MAG: SagB/ThcOx family dehydrogenase [Acidobacteria bacterium]|nr:SagB/ThcOx family dehydrogenase [Acidobacteriota bacterium]